MRRSLAALPLALAYGLYPLSMALPRLAEALSGRPVPLPPRNWIDAAWLVLTLAAAGPLLARLAARAKADGSDGSGRPASYGGHDNSGGSSGPRASGGSHESDVSASSGKPGGYGGPGDYGRSSAKRATTAPAILGLAASGVGLAAILRFGPLAFAPPETLSLAPLFMELKPFLYLAVTAVLLASAGPPDREDFIRAGLFLAPLLLADLALSSLGAGELRRPFGSGEVNYDACLLLVSLVFALRSPSPRPLAVLLLAAGLAATLSRTGLAAGALAALLGRWRPGWRVLLAGALAASVGLSVAARGVSVETAEDLDRYQMWRTAADLFDERPWALLTGFAPGRPLPAEAPPELADLFSAQAEEWSAEGTHAFNFHAFWLRAAVTWGVLPPLFLALGAPLFAWRTRRATLLALSLCLWAMGSTMGLFYLSNVAPPILLALRTAFRRAETPKTAPDAARAGL